MKDICYSKVREGKLEGLYTVNTNPLTNEFCMKMHKNPKNICSVCYAISGLRTFRKSAVNGMERNSRILSLREYSVDEARPRFKPGSFVRFLSYGDLTGDTCFRNFCTIAKASPGAHFTMWTKRKDVVARNLEHVPSNLRLIYSIPKMNPEPGEMKIPKGFNGIFNTFRKEYAMTHRVRINCHGKCIECMKCYDGTESVISEITKRAAGAGGNKAKRWI